MIKRIAIIFMAFILCGAVGSAQDKTYTVKAGETLHGIANRQNVKADSLLKWNNLKLVNTNKKDKKGNPIKEVQPAIKTGQILIVGKETSKYPEVEPNESGQKQQIVEENVSETQSPETVVETHKSPTDRTERGGAGKSINQKNDVQPEKKSSFWWHFICIVAGFGGGIFCWEKWLRKSFNKKEKKGNEGFIKQLQGDKQELKNKIKELEDKNKKLSYENNEIRKECDGKQQQYEKAIKMLRENQHIPQNVVSDIVKQTTIPEKPKPATTGNSSTLYAQSIFEEHFNKIAETPNESTVFELHLQNAQNATFTIYNAAKQRIIANPAFLEGCDKQVLTNATNVKTEAEGAAQLQDDGKWKVIKKLNITIL